MKESAKNITFSEFSTVDAASCTPITYTLTYADGSAYDTSLFTFYENERTISVFTNDLSKRFNYTFKIVG